MSWLARALAVLAMLAMLAVGAVWVLLGSEPALAHVGGIEPSNYRVRVTANLPPGSGVAARVGVGGQVSLSNRSGEVVTVAGYRGEPFLRLSPGRIEVNGRSTTLADNPNLSPARSQPDPTAPSRWVSVAEGNTIVWSDARLTGGAGAGRSDEGRWSLPLRVGDTGLTLAGTWTWVPPPARWPWLVGIATAAVGAGAIGWLGRWHPVAATLVVVAGAAHVAHVVGAGLAAQNGGTSGWGGTLGIGVVWWALIVVGVVSTLRHSEFAGLAVGVAGAALFLSGLGDLSVFFYSQLPFAWPASIERILVAFTVGAGMGLAVAGGRSLFGGDGVDHGRS